MTRAEIVGLGATRLLRLIDEHGDDNRYAPDEMTNGRTSLRMFFGRYGDAIADAVTAQRPDVRVSYLRGDRTTGQWTASYFEVRHA